MKERSGPRGAKSHLSEKENHIRATSARRRFPKNITNKRGVSMNYESALEYIHAVQWAGHKPGLSRTRTLLAALGDPHKKLRFVHVAGTNGKGSTAAMLASCLQAAGYRVGLYTSPFINRFNERIQVNGEQRPDDALVRLV